MTNKVQFLLNDELVNLTDVDPNLTVLDYLREVRLNTTAKEGCGSGDCGACTLVIAEINPTNSTQLVYKSINSCITFIGSLHGKQLITLDSLEKDGRLHPIQQSMIDNHASQCGFCTPGIVMSCYALHKNNPTPSRDAVIEGLSGNLCRCTGYRSIIDAAMLTSASNISIDEKATIERLAAINRQPALAFESKDRCYFAAKTLAELAAYLLKNPQATLLSGGTDLALAVTQNLADFKQLVYLGQVAELNHLSQDAQQIRIGSALAYCHFDQALSKLYPELGKMIQRLGAAQVRNVGTLGGNIGNASPIADMPPALIALGAKITLQCGNKQREILLQDFFIDYKKTALKTSEFIRDIIIPKPTRGTANCKQVLKVYKVSKRFDDDISCVLVACFIELNDNQITTLRIAFGGMAAIPKRADCCEAALRGKIFNQENVNAAKQALKNDFSPLSDVRASAAYRIKVAQNILQKFYLEINQPCHATRVENYAPSC